MKMFAFQLGRRSAAEDSSRLTRQPLLDIGAGERASTPQVSLFDNLTRSVAGTATRRGALRVALTGLAGLALSKIGINTAWAAANCLFMYISPEVRYSSVYFDAIVSKH